MSQWASAHAFVYCCDPFELSRSFITSHRKYITSRIVVAIQLRCVSNAVERASRVFAHEIYTKYQYSPPVRHASQQISINNIKRKYYCLGWAINTKITLSCGRRGRKILYVTMWRLQVSVILFCNLLCLISMGEPHSRRLFDNFETCDSCCVLSLPRLRFMWAICDWDSANKAKRLMFLGGTRTDDVAKLLMFKLQYESESATGRELQSKLIIKVRFRLEFAGSLIAKVHI